MYKNAKVKGGFKSKAELNFWYGTDKVVHNVQYLSPVSKLNHKNQLYIQYLKCIYALFYIWCNIYFH